MAFDWDWRWNLERLLPWLLPLLCWALRRNQSLRSLAAFVPGLLLMACADLVTRPAGLLLPSQLLAPVAEAIVTLSAGLTTVWLLSGVPGKRPASAVWRSFLALLLAMAFNIAVALAYDTCSVLGFAIAYTLCFLAPLCIAAGAAMVVCRRRRTLQRFATVLFIALVVTAFAAMFLLMVYAAMKGTATSDLVKAGTGFLALGIPCCFSIATFVVFTCFNAEYRGRWRVDLDPLDNPPSSSARVEAIVAHQEGEEDKEATA